MPIDLKRLQDVFQAVAGLSPDERVAVLERECGGDDELLRRVEALLKAHDDSAELPGVEETGAYVAAPPVELGQVFAGRYKLREKLGEGGMGAVFVADQTAPVQRRVAIKVIRSGLDSLRLLARFEQERQALALMDHPNIAKVLDAGIDEAQRPYFAMELVKGLPLTRYCDDARLSPRERIELFVPVCQAVQHAHQKGIIHRDLKPSNILVGLYDGRAVPKVIDFGVAKATGPRLTEQSIYTELGSLIGTLEYMSPEQAELNNLDIDTRSDVYALGVILYELLTGTVPFSRRELEKAGLVEMLRVIKEVEPHRPSTRLSGSGTLPSIAANRHTEPKKLTALVRGELDWIVMKALEKDRGRRYETANALGLDVQRYLEGEPVLAAPASAAYRLRKLVRRNKSAFLAASLVLLALVAGVAGTTWGLIRAHGERRVAEKNATMAMAAAVAEKQAKEQALANFTLAKESVEKYLGTVTDDLELKSADFHRLRKKLLESALPFFQRIAEQKSDDPEVEVGRGEAYHRLGLVRMALGEDEAAVQDFESMRAIYGNLAALFPGIGSYRRYEAGSQTNLGQLLARLGRHAEAEAAYRRALTVQEKLVAGDPTVPEYSRDLAMSLNSLGALLVGLRKSGEAEAAYRRALALEEKLAADFPTVPEYRRQLASSHHNLGDLLARLGKHGEAEAAYRHAISLHAKLFGEFPMVPDYRANLATSQNSLGNLLAEMGKHGEAEAAYRRALAFQEKLVTDFPAVPEYRVSLAWSHNNLGRLLLGLGKHGEAEAGYRRTLALLEKLAADFPAVPNYRMDLAKCHNNLGALLSAMGKHGEAEAAYREALAVQEKLAADFPAVPEYSLELAKSHSNRGDLLRLQGKSAEAEAAFRRALDIHESLAADFPTVPAYRQNQAFVHYRLGDFLLGLGRIGEAETAIRHALDIREKLAADFHTVPQYRDELASSLDSLGNILRARAGERWEAEAAYHQALGIREKLAAEFPAVPRFGVDLCGIYVNFGNLMADSGQPEAARAWYQKAIDRLEPMVAREPRLVQARQKLCISHANRAVALDALGRHTEAVRDWEQARKLDDGSLTEQLRSGPIESRLRMCRKDKDAAGCIAAAAEYESLKRTDAPGLFRASRFRAICAAVIREDPKTPATDAGRLANEQAELAMAWLRKAVAAGFKEAELMKKYSDLDALRENPEFKALLAELSKGKVLDKK